MTLNKLFMLIIVASILPVACEPDATSSEDDQALINSDNNEEENMALTDQCFVDDECNDNEYCKAIDSSISPEGNCSPLSQEGEVCIRGTQCNPNLVCVKVTSSGSGLCTSIPMSCADSITCECAINSFCASPGGSSCSVEIPEQPESSMTTTCSQLAASEMMAGSEDMMEN